MRLGLKGMLFGLKGMRRRMQEIRFREASGHGSQGAIVPRPPCGTGAESGERTSAQAALPESGHFEAFAPA